MKNLFQRSMVHLNKAFSMLSSCFQHHSPRTKQVAPFHIALAILCHIDGFESYKAACHKVTELLFPVKNLKEHRQSNPVKQIWIVNSHKQCTYRGSVRQQVSLMTCKCKHKLFMGLCPQLSNPENDAQTLFSDNSLLKQLKHPSDSVKHGAILTTRLIPENSPHKK